MKKKKTGDGAMRIEQRGHSQANLIIVFVVALGVGCIEVLVAAELKEWFFGIVHDLAAFLFAIAFVFAFVFTFRVRIRGGQLGGAGAILSGRSTEDIALGLADLEEAAAIVKEDVGVLRSRLPVEFGLQDAGTREELGGFFVILMSVESGALGAEVGEGDPLRLDILFRFLVGWLVCLACIVCGPVVQFLVGCFLSCTAREALFSIVERGRYGSVLLHRFGLIGDDRVGHDGVGICKRKYRDGIGRRDQREGGKRGRGEAPIDGNLKDDGRNKSERDAQGKRRRCNGA